MFLKCDLIVSYGLLIPLYTQAFPAENANADRIVANVLPMLALVGDRQGSAVYLIVAENVLP